MALLANEMALGISPYGPLWACGGLNDLFASPSEGDKLQLRHCRGHCWLLSEQLSTFLRCLATWAPTLASCDLVPTPLLWLCHSSHSVFRTAKRNYKTKAGRWGPHRVFLADTSTKPLRKFFFSSLLCPLPASTLILTKLQHTVFLPSVPAITLALLLWGWGWQDFLLKYYSLSQALSTHRQPYLDGS